MLTRLIAAIRQRLRREPTLEEEMRTLHHRLTRNERRLRRLETLQTELHRRQEELRSLRSERPNDHGRVIPLMEPAGHPMID